LESAPPASAQARARALRCRHWSARHQHFEIRLVGDTGDVRRKRVERRAIQFVVQAPGLLVAAVIAGEDRRGDLLHVAREQRRLALVERLAQRAEQALAGIGPAVFDSQNFLQLFLASGTLFGIRAAGLGPGACACIQVSPLVGA